MDLTDIFKALADETRIRMLNLLGEGELCVCDIEEILNIQQSNASRHLNKLKLAGLIVSMKKSQWVYYRINNKTISKYPFLEMVINDELKKVELYKKDSKKLQKRKAEGKSCEPTAKTT